MDAATLTGFLREKTIIFKGFPEARLAELIQGSRLSSFEPDEFIVEVGEEGRYFGILIEGTARALVIDNTGAEHPLADLQPGAVFGEMSILTGDRTTASIVGATRCKALLVPAALFSAMVLTHPPALQALTKLVASRAKTIGQEESRQAAATAITRSRDPYGLDLHSDEPMIVLVVNCGSSSLKYSLFTTETGALLASGMVESIGRPEARHAHRRGEGNWTWTIPAAGYPEAFAAMVKALVSAETGAVKSVSAIQAVGHRVVHGGEEFCDPVVITDAVEAGIERLADLAPLHNPVNLAGIREARRCFPDAVQVAVFDTAFHHTLPPFAYLYGLPYEFYEQKHIRRYGFHGMSHAYVALRSAQYLKRPFGELETISCHLGNGASACAIDHGRSVDTSMGFTPTEGLIMGTRCGQVDPGIFAYLMRREGMTVDQFGSLINKESGLKGLSGFSADMREIQRAAGEGDHRAILAFKTFCYQVRKQIGAYVAVMNGLDVLVFTGGIGQGSADVRSMVCRGLDTMGIRMDEARNRAAAAEPGDVVDIATADSPVRILVVRTDEERMIARETLRTLALRPALGNPLAENPLPVPIEISAHHVHLSRAHVEALFGAGHRLTPRAELSQPGQFACEETVNLVGPKGRVERVRVLGPERRESQVEIAMTEQYRLGVHPPVRESGDLERTPGLVVEGSDGRSVTLERGVICAMRHVHMEPDVALRLGLRDRYVVRVRVEGDRELTFGDVLVRVHPDFRLALHLDTDEGNAACVRTGMTGRIEAVQSRG